MNPAVNPFAPGAGTQPPELAGRQDVLDGAALALDRLKGGFPARSQMLLGLRGVGKTVLLNRVEELAEDRGYLTIALEAPDGRRLAEMLIPPLRSMLFKLSRLARARDMAQRALGALRSFAVGLKVSVGDIEFGVEADEGTADSGDLEADLPEVLLLVARAAKEAERPVALLIDEVQYLQAKDLAALIVSVHRVGQKNLPFIVFGAGLPQLAALAGEAKSYAERLFLFVNVGPLNAGAARVAVRAPLERQNVRILDEALDMIIAATRGYPYFIQEWGSHTWNEAESSPVTPEHVTRASAQALDSLDKGFFRVRFDRLTPREKDYVRAMAELGDGPHRSGEIAHRLRIAVSSAAPLRSGLIKKGMVFSPQHGDTEFTVPMFDQFLRRIMPDWKP